METHNVYVKWLVVAALYVVSLFWCYYFGFLTAAFMADQSHITIVIFLLFMAATAFLGKTCYDYGEIEKEIINRRLDLGWQLSEYAMLLGIIGTVIGFILMLSQMSSIDISSANAAAKLLTEIPYSLGTALYTTVFGAIGNLLIKIQCTILQYRIDEDYH